MGRHFACTACGLCCRGWLPLTLDDALVHAGRFPLAMVWRPLRQGSKAFAWTETIGLSLRPKGGRPVAVQIVPTVFLPSDMECPALKDDGLCGLQDRKPLRCRTMPFYPYREEQDQADMLVPRPGWRCDTGPQAPLVYQDKTIIEPQDFRQERQALLLQAETIRAYGRWAMQVNPHLSGQLQACAAKAAGGYVALGVAGLLRQLPVAGRAALAQQQYDVLQHSLTRLQQAGRDPDYQRSYTDWMWELERLLPEETGGRD